jgi:hypothetical protein
VENEYLSQQVKRYTEVNLKLKNVRDSQRKVDLAKVDHEESRGDLVESQDDLADQDALEGAHVGREEGLEGLEGLAESRDALEGDRVDHEESQGDLAESRDVLAEDADLAQDSDLNKLTREQWVHLIIWVLLHLFR